jgi:hypothetical protein
VERLRVLRLADLDGISLLHFAGLVVLALKERVFELKVAAHQLGDEVLSID